MKWIVGEGASQRPVDLARAIEYVKTGVAPGQHHLVVAREDAAEYLNLFLAWERAMLFWVRFQVGLPHILVARQPRPISAEVTEVAFAGQTPYQPWFAPVGDTLKRAEGLALLEAYVRTQSVPTEFPACATGVKPPLPHQLLLFEDATRPEVEPECRSVKWEPWGSAGLWQEIPVSSSEEGSLPF
jgi:hypothetical protein